MFKKGKANKAVSLALSLVLMISMLTGISVYASGTVAKVTSGLKAGSYSSSKVISLRTMTNGAKIYYTTSGKTPTTKSTRYTKAFTITKSTTVKAIAAKSGMKNSPVSTFAYKINKVPTNLSGSFSMSGSSALFPLAKYVSALFKAKNPKLSITINAGGSGTGLNNVLAGTVDIGNSDVYAKEKLSASDAAKLVDHKVCIVGVATIVSPDVAALVKNISTSNLKAIFSGSISNWKSVGGPDRDIVVVNRPSSSGTRALFVKWALGGQKDIDGDTSLQTDDSNALAKTVSNTNGAIGYLALSYVESSSLNFGVLKINGYAPTYSNIYKNSYKVWGYEHMYTLGSPKTNVKAFLNYMVSKELVPSYEALGYGAISKLNSAARSSR
ncbi:MAG: phosphate ABC transporter substrate-binding protein PstS family protein [Clostridia bacterium]